MASKGNTREKFGKPGVAIVGTRVFARPLPYFVNLGIPAFTLMIINDNLPTPTMQSAQVYDKGNGFTLGRNYDPATLVHPLTDGKVDEWKGKLYKQTTDADSGIADGTFDGCVVILPIAEAGSPKAEDKADEDADAELEEAAAEQE